MGKIYEEISPDLADWIGQQRIFFVATAPLSGHGHLNCSPKGMDTFRILGPREIAYVDLTGSGIETIAHVRENRRILFMFCAFSGPPKIVRLHGSGEVLTPGNVDYESFISQFPKYLGARAIVRAQLSRLADSCGFGVPQYEFVADRDTLLRSAESKGAEGLVQYRSDKNARSLDGLRGLEPE